MVKKCEKITPSFPVILSVSQIRQIYNNPLISLDPFKSLRFSTDSSSAVIDWIEFFFRDEAAKDCVKTEALVAFGADSAEVRTLGEELEWKDINGVRASIDPLRYSVSRSSEE